MSGGEGLVKKTKDKKKVEFNLKEELNQADFRICNTHIAWNGRFFAIGLVSQQKSLFGIYSFDKANCSFQLVKWESKFSFSNFYVDDHLTTVMFLSRSQRALDYNFLLWRFDTSKLDERHLQRLDN